MDNQEISIGRYVQIGVRRKWWIILPFLASIIIAFGYYKLLPKIYKATTVILVQPQKIPESYVRTTVGSLADQLNTMNHEILSRTRLEKIIESLNPYPELRNKVSIEEIVEKMKKLIEVTFPTRSTGDRGQNVFSVSFEGENPQMVMLVTNQLATMFIEDNLKGRELRAESTSIFLGKELGDIEHQLLKKEKDIKGFRERNMGKLPQQLDANLRILERLQQQLQNTNMAIKMAEDRSIIFQSQMDQLKNPSSVQRTRWEAPSESPVDGRGWLVDRLAMDPVMAQYNQLLRELDNARSKYTENHPDIVALKKRIAILEPEHANTVEKYRSDQSDVRLKQKSQTKAGSQSPDSFSDRLLAQYLEQYTGARFEAERLKIEETKLKNEILLYQKRIEDTPKLEQELLLLNRDYDLLKSAYQSLMDKKIQSQMAENLERRQQGEQFKVLDPARYPEKPIRPDGKKILLLGAGIGLMLGIGLAWFRESLDQSFHSEEDLEYELELPVIAILPNLAQEAAFLPRRRIGAPALQKFKR